MSLLRIRRERKELNAGPVRPARLWKLVVALILVYLMIQYLARMN